MALYCHHCEQTTVALRLMYRVRYLISLMFGHETPEIATCDVSTTSKHLYMQITARVTSVASNDLLFKQLI